MTSPREFGVKLTKLTDKPAVARVQHAMGAAAKKAATKAVTKDLGADLRMSNMRGKAKLSSGYDLDTAGATAHLRPKGLWNLADKGRRRQGTIRPRKKGGKKAVTVAPGKKGIRAYSHYTPSRGLGTVDDAIDLMRVDVPKAATKVVTDNIRSM